MNKVGWTEALSFGFSMFGYFLFVGFLGGGALLLGTAMIIDDPARIIGFIFMAIGYTVLISGTYGALYKTIADGVGRGNGHIQGPQTIQQQIQARLYE